MTKTFIIELNEKDENVVLQILKKFKVKIESLTASEDAEEATKIREILHEKYVLNGEWDTMTLEDKEDAVLLEKILLTDRSQTVDIEKVKNELRKRISEL